MKLRAALAVAVALSPAAAHAATPHWNAWLCRPGLAANYCNTDLSTTVYWADGTESVVAIADPKAQPIDCFYVYPTVSTERRGNADLSIRAEEKQTAVAQAARFSQVCRVFAPVYRQRTVYRDQFKGSSDVAYASVLAAWRDYLANWNDGRGVVLIGHSQGEGMLERLLTEQGGSLRKLLVSAVLLGGGVTVGDDERFAGFPACRSLGATGCIVAYEAYSATPPSGSGTMPAGQHALCVNPAAPGSASAAPITPIFPWFVTNGIIPVPSPQPRTIWIGLPDLYNARCVRQGSQTWLLVKRIAHPGDRRPMVRSLYAGSSSLHAADVNIALGALITLVRAETKAYLHAH